MSNKQQGKGWRKPSHSKHYSYAFVCVFFACAISSLILLSFNKVIIHTKCIQYMSLVGDVSYLDHYPMFHSIGDPSSQILYFNKMWHSHRQCVGTYNTLLCSKKICCLHFQVQISYMDRHTIGILNLNIFLLLLHNFSFIKIYNETTLHFIS